MSSTSKKIKKLYQYVCEISGEKEYKRISDDEMLSSLQKQIQHLKKGCELAETESGRIQNRIAEIIEVIQNLACLKYDKKAKVDGSGDQIDALAAGINMMGEELQDSTVSLSEKEILLNEVHHRVKNNLQLVSSLLNIQSSYISDPYALAKFRESQNRVNSMALIHEKLYTSKDFSKIDFADYMNSIAHYLSAVYNISPERVSVVIDVKPDSGFLPLDTALPCGLIINEMMSNSFKYAFPDNKKGKISFSMTQKKAKHVNEYQLVFRDNGKGLPKKMDITKTESLGMQLISTLTDQIDGTLKYEYKNGACFTITFKQV